jgi:hypothetical protein
MAIYISPLAARLADVRTMRISLEYAAVNVSAMESRILTDFRRFTQLCNSCVAQVLKSHTLQYPHLGSHHGGYDLPMLRVRGMNHAYFRYLTVATSPDYFADVVLPFRSCCLRHIIGASWLLAGKGVMQREPDQSGCAQI